MRKNSDFKYKSDKLILVELNLGRLKDNKRLKDRLLIYLNSFHIFRITQKNKT